MSSILCLDNPISPPIFFENFLENGLTKEDFTKIAREMIGIPAKELAEIAGISTRTLSRLKPQETLPRNASEVALSTVRTFHRALQIFGKKETALAWIRRPNAALRQKTPLQALKSRFGAEEVLDILTRIEHGVYS